MKRLILTFALLISIFGLHSLSFGNDINGGEEEFIGDDLEGSDVLDLDDDFDSDFVEEDFNNNDQSSSFEETSLGSIEGAIPGGLERVSDIGLVRGLDSQQNITINGSATYSVNGGSFSKTNLVGNGDSVRIKMSPDSRYSRYKESRLVFGNQVFVFSISTETRTDSNFNNSQDGDVNEPIKSETRDKSCSGLPDNSSWNGDSTYLQTKVGTSWLPAYVPVEHYKNSNSLCKFSCNSGFEWDGFSCNEIPESTDSSSEDSSESILTDNNIVDDKGYLIDENTSNELSIIYRDFKNKNYYDYNIKFELLYNKIISKEKNKGYEKLINEHINNILFGIYIFDSSKKGTSKFDFSIKVLKNNITELKKYL